MTSESELAVAARFLSEFAAEVALSALRAAGVDAVLRRDDRGGLEAQPWTTGVAILVRREDLDQATEILSATPLPDDTGETKSGDEEV